MNGPDPIGAMWSVVAAMTGIMVALCTVAGFIIRLMIGNAVLRLEGRIDAIDMTTIRTEVMLTRDRVHAMAQRVTIIEGYGQRINDLQESHEALEIVVIEIGKEVAKLEDREDQRHQQGR